MQKANWKALLPIGVFLVIYLGLGFLFEYGLEIPMGFYNIPIVVSFLAALLVACLQNPKVSFEDKLAIMSKGVGDKNIITMILIFMTAGIFVGVAGRSSAENVAYFLLSLIPAQYAVLVIFMVSCFVSLSMGTSTGTITLITPIALAVSQASGFNAALCIGAVISGAMFGDNLSFISDTTIAACNGQGCPMKDKFRTNLSLALPAAFFTLVILGLKTVQTPMPHTVSMDYNLIQIIPYLLVLLGGIMGINVFIVLLLGIVSGSLIMLVTGILPATKLLSHMSSGAAGMYETAMVAILVSALCALMQEYGGFAALLSFIRKICKSSKGAQLGIGLLAGAMDIATANNTVAIVVANPIAREIASEYHISPRTTASILDTFSCIFQGIIPYGAQMLVALSAAQELGYELSAFDIMPRLYYPYLLLASCLFSLFLRPGKRTCS